MRQRRNKGMKGIKVSERNDDFRLLGMNIFAFMKNIYSGINIYVS